MLVTALVTPFREGPDREAFVRLARFALEHGAHAVLVAGATGEGGALAEDERDALLDAALEAAPPERVWMALGAGRLPDVIARGRRALERGVRDLMLTDAPYAGASSAALRAAWHEPVASALPEARLWPHAAPVRTGTELLPDDLAGLSEACPNVAGVVDSTGRLARMERVRALCGQRLTLLCGDDVLMRDAMIDPHIRAEGACAATALLAPVAVRALHDACLALDAVRARELHEALTLLHGLQTVTAEESTSVGGEPLLVPQRARDPVPLKTALALLGAVRPVWRAPLAPLGPNGTARVRTALRLTGRRHPDVLEPVCRAFGADLAACLEAATELAREAT
jgi:4-hydroxy-tetrahydrodipicolinate synthase